MNRISLGELTMQDLRDAFRVLRSPQLMAAAGVVSLALGIGADAEILASSREPSGHHQIHGPGSWSTYRDDVNAFSFRYPPELRAVERPVSEAHIEGLVRAVDVLAKSRSSDTYRSTVLHILVTVCGDSLPPDPAAARVPCVDEGFYRGVCHHFIHFQLGNADALQCVDYGSAACHWSALILRGNTTVRVMTPATDQVANESEWHTFDDCAERLAPSNALFPIKTMFASFRFGSPAK